MRILILSCGTRNKLLRFFKAHAGENGRVVATDCSAYAPALYEADAFYLVPRMTEPGYLDRILEICRLEKIQAVLPLFEDELTLLANNRELFEGEGIRTIVSDAETIELCRDKYRFYLHLREKNIPVLPTYENVEQFAAARQAGEVDFPVFVKPVRGCGSTGISKVEDMELLELLAKRSKEPILIQQFCTGQEYGVDLYVDLESKKPAAIFTKKKLRMRAGETEKSVSVKDPALFALVEQTAAAFDFAGPIDMDVFCMDGQYYVSEVNPRFGGGYPHAYDCGVQFPALIAQNLSGQENAASIGAYEAGMVMMKYTDELVLPIAEL